MNTNRLIVIGTHISAFFLGAFIMYSFQRTSLSDKERIDDNIYDNKVSCNMEDRSKGNAAISANENISVPDIVVPTSHVQITSYSLTPEEQQIETKVKPPFVAVNFFSKTQQMLLDWAKSDPYGSLTWLFSGTQDALRFKMAYPFERIATVRQIVSNVSTEQLPAVLDILRNNHDDGLLISALCTAVSGDQPKLNRLSVLDNLDMYATNDAMSEQLRNALLAEWAASDVQSAQAWALQQEDSNLRDTSIVTVASQLVNLDPIAAIQLAKNSLSDSLRSGEFEYLVSVWIDQDPQSVSVWLGEQPSSPDIDNALRLLTLKTMALDPAR